MNINKKEAFEQIYDDYAKKIFNFIYSFCKNIHTVEDLTQETFLKAFQNFNPEHSNPNINAWLSWIAINIWKNKLRYDKRHGIYQTVSFDFLTEFKDNLQQQYEQFVSAEPTPLETFERKEMQKYIEQLIYSLPIRYRIPMILYTYDNKSYEEISEIINRSIGTVKSLISRAKDKLKADILKYIK